MDDEIFSLMREKAKKTGSNDPLEVANDHHIVLIPLKGTITGYAAAYRTLAVIGYSQKLRGIWLPLVLWHELTHVFSGDIYDPTIGDRIVDSKIFTQEVDSLYIPRHEKRANLVGADMSVPDADVLELIHYDSSSMKAYRNLKQHQDSLIREFEELRTSADIDSASTRLKVKLQDLKNRIHDVSRALSEVEGDLMDMNAFLTFPEIAGELGINERILRYKLEAMRLRGFDIDRQELEHYSRMFDGAIPASS